MHYYNSLGNEQTSLKKIVNVTAKSLAIHCTHYYAQIIDPVKGLKETKKSGKLPKNKKEKNILIENIINWIFDNSKCDELFTLFLDENMINSEDCTKFCHYDDTCCWDLNLTEAEFKALQKELKQNNLPAEIFYDSSKTICIDKDVGIIGKIFRKLGFECENTIYYSPKQWQSMKKQGGTQ